MHQLNDLQLIVGIYALAFLILEIVLSYWQNRNIYHAKEIFTNISIFVGYATLVRPFTIVWMFILFYQFKPLAISHWENSLTSIVIALLITDFTYYWEHRFFHRVKILWALHQPHHSSPGMNLTTALRLSWVLPWIRPVFYLPWILIGFSPELIVAMYLLNLAYQFWLHTQCIPKLGIFEWVFNTPSHHRVHHGSNVKYIDKNFGGIFIVWDRLFNSFERENEPVRFGVTTGFVGHNPFKVEFQPIYQLFRGSLKKEQEMKDNAGQVF